MHIYIYIYSMWIYLEEFQSKMFYLYLFIKSSWRRKPFNWNSIGLPLLFVIHCMVCCNTFSATVILWNSFRNKVIRTPTSHSPSQSRESFLRLPKLVRNKRSNIRTEICDNHFYFCWDRENYLQKREGMWKKVPSNVFLLFFGLW